jgi:hypothetical protein
MQPVQQKTTGHADFGSSRSIVRHATNARSNPGSVEDVTTTDKATDKGTDTAEDRRVKASELASMFEQKAAANKSSPTKLSPPAVMVRKRKCCGESDDVGTASSEEVSA